MKKFFILICFISFTLIISCTRAKIIDAKISVDNMTLEQKREYLKSNLMKISNEIGPLLNDENFVKFVMDKASEKFDGEYEVLIKDLLNDPIYGKKLNTEKMREGLNAFQNLEGNNFYPQIYIPALQAEEDSRTTALTQTNQNRTTRKNLVAKAAELVYYDASETQYQDSYPSYVYDERNSSITPSGHDIDEDYADENQVWVVGLNESVDDAGKVTESVKRGEDRGEHDNPTPTPARDNFYIKDILLRNSKESWLGGASEINIKSAISYYNHSYLGIETNGVWDGWYYGKDAYNDLFGKDIAKIKRKDFRNLWYKQNFNFPLVKDWQVNNYYKDRIVYCYCIFEYDGWPAGRKLFGNKFVSYSGSDQDKKVWKMEFRSADAAYGGFDTNEIPGVTNSEWAYPIYFNISGFGSALNDKKFLYYPTYIVDRSDLRFNVIKR